MLLLMGTLSLLTLILRHGLLSQVLLITLHPFKIICTIANPIEANARFMLVMDKVSILEPLVPLTTPIIPQSPSSMLPSSKIIVKFVPQIPPQSPSNLLPISLDSDNTLSHLSPSHS
ncbi:unnamed protein product [Vicia faba]|uniref:Uncharacterized protein n=1 Tax=Vicia faba TaxID=3906 RepID=A0AAV0ZNM2_VICFA|nr:unnamed protein product [Vicia faba]